MGLATSVLNDMVDAATANITHISLHSAAPASGANELAVTRKAVTWNAAAGGSASITGAQTFADVPAAATVACIGYWNAISAGTVQGDDDGAVTDETYAGAGSYTVDSVTISAS